MAPPRSHSQIQSRSGGITGHLGLVVLPGINGTVSRPWGGVLAGLQSEGEAVLLDRGTEVGVSERWVPRVALHTLQLRRYRDPAPGQTGICLALGPASQGPGPGCLEALCRPLLGPGSLRWATSRSHRQAMPPPPLTPSVKHYPRDPVKKRSALGTN